MKKLFTGFVLLGALLSTTNAFLDVSPRSKVYEPLQKLIEKGIVTEGSFFQPSADIPLQMFLDIILKESEVDFIESKALDQKFPSNIQPNSVLYPLVKTSIKKRLISPTKDFKRLAPISKLEALKAIITLKRIAPPRRISSIFAKEYGPEIPKGMLLSIDGKYLETGIASNIITKKDLSTITENLSRQDLIFWLTNYRSGEGNRSRLVKDNPFIKSKKLTVLVNGKDVGPVSERLKNSSKDGYQFPEEFIFEKVYQDVLEKYRFTDELTKEKQKELINAAIAGMVEKLDDEHSNYVVPKDSHSFLDSMNGNFEGIGAYVEMVDGKFTITAPIADSPAEKSGIRAKDVVSHVGGESVAEKSVNEIISLIKGPAGTEVELTIQRKGKELIVSVRREKVVIPNIEFEMIQSIPVIRLKQFNNDLFSEFEAIIKKHVIGKNKRGLILDFRNNRGGLLDQAVKLAEFFSKKGETILKIDYKDEKEIIRSEVDGPLLNQKNIIILQNEGTASSSEVFTSFLKSMNRATVWGSKSYGKGTIQQVLKYSNEGVMKITIGKWLTPDDEWVHKTGVLPDKEFEERTPEQIKNKVDPLLEAAVRKLLNR